MVDQSRRAPNGSYEFIDFRETAPASFYQVRSQKNVVEDTLPLTFYVGHI